MAYLSTPGSLDLEYSAMVCTWLRILRDVVISSLTCFVWLLATVGQSVIIRTWSRASLLVVAKKAITTMVEFGILTFELEQYLAASSIREIKESKLESGSCNSHILESAASA